MKRLIVIVLLSMVMSLGTHSAFAAEFQWERLVGSAIGSAIGAASQNRPPYPPGRPPYPPGRPPYYPDRRYDTTPIRTVYVQQPTQVAVAPQQVHVEVTAASASASSTPVSLVPNTTVATVPAASKDIIKKIMDALKKNANKQWDKAADGFDGVLMTDDKAAALAKKLLDEGMDKKKVSELLVAIENGEADLAGKLVSDLTDDPLQGMQIKRAMAFGELLSEITDQLEEGGFTHSDISNWKKAFVKMKLAAKQQKTVDRCLAELKGVLDFVEILSDYKASTRPVPVPTDPVTLVFCPTLRPDAVYALDTATFLVGTADDVFSVDDGYLVDKVAVPPIFATTAIGQTTTDVNAVILVNPSNQSATYYLDDNTQRTLAPGTQATFAVPGSGTISIRSRSGNKSSFSVKAGRYSLLYRGNSNWGIEAAPIEITLDNSTNPFPLNCIVNRTPYTIASGDQLTLSSNGGILDVRFARGEDVSQFVRYQFDSTGTYKIGLDKKDGKWALFPADAVPMPTGG